MDKISNERKIIYLLLLGMLPIFFVSIYFYTENTYINTLSYDLDNAITLAEEKNAKEYMNKQVKSIFKEVDHFWIDKEIETIKPLTDEAANIKDILSQGYHPNEDEMRRRINFLTSGQNNIAFTEGSIKSYKDFQETIETLSHPVDVGRRDLQSILSKIEGVSLDGAEMRSGRPHLIITECKLEKKKGLSQDCLQLDLKVLKREYLK